MKKLVGAVVAVVLLSSSVTPASAGATPVVVTYGSGALGAWISGSIVGVAGFLGLYDLTRRLTCSGDFLNLGGPGFTSPITGGASVIRPPKCPRP